MPVSKKRKPKRRNTAPVKTSTTGGSSATSSSGSPKKKLSRQQIIIYLISIVMILSLAISYLVGNGRSIVPRQPTLTPTIAAETTSTPASASTEEAQPSPTVEPTTAN